MYFSKNQCLINDLTILFRSSGDLAQGVIESWLNVLEVKWAVSPQVTGCMMHTDGEYGIIPSILATRNGADGKGQGKGCAVTYREFAIINLSGETQSMRDSLLRMRYKSLFW